MPSTQLQQLDLNHLGGGVAPALYNTLCVCICPPPKVKSLAWGVLNHTPKSFALCQTLSKKSDPKYQGKIDQISVIS